MLLLLPPSEGKARPASGPPLDLGSLGSPELTEHRARVLAALQETSARPDAAAVLGVGASLAPEVARGAHLTTEPTAPAAHVYAGVLYAAAGLGPLHDAAVRAARRGSPGRLARLTDDVRVISALWGAVSPVDRIPAYRLSMGVDLPGVGPLAPSWREPLAKALDARAVGDVVVDARSAPYAAAWKVPAGAEHVPVVVQRELAGRRSVVSHHAKHTRGVLTGHLLGRRAAPPTTPEGLLEAATELLGTVTDGREVIDVTLAPAVSPSRTGARPRPLTVVVRDV